MKINWRVVPFWIPIIAAFCFAFMAEAGTRNYYPNKEKAVNNIYVAQVTNIYDGDTFTIEIPIWPNTYKTISLRVNGVDTPEMSWRAECDEEKEQAEAAKQFIAEKIKESNYSVQVTGVKHGKFAGRVLGNVILASGETVEDLLISNGFARVYHGGARESWCK